MPRKDVDTKGRYGSLTCMLQEVVIENNQLIKQEKEKQPRETLQKWDERKAEAEKE